MAKGDKNRTAERLGCLLIFALVCGVLWVVYAPSYLAARGTGQYTKCRHVLKDLAVRMDAFYEKSERLPKELGELGAIPRCPAAGEDTYTAGYTILPDGNWLIVCKGENHKWARKPADYPRYHSAEGSLEPPPKS